jgi:acyl carrier protein
MTSGDIRAEIHQFIQKSFIFDSNKALDDSTSLLGSGVIDSTGILELISHIEQHFDIKCEDSELVGENFDSVEKITAFITRKLPSQQ